LGAIVDGEGRLEQGPTGGAPAAVELRGISRRYGRALALDRVDLELARGELHLLAGGRGAGKSALLRLLAGVERPDGGQILVDGEPRRIDSPRAALRLGIGALLERPALAGALTVAESVVLGAEPGRLLLRRRRAAARVAELGERLGLALDPAARVGALDLAERRQVELLALEHRGARVLLLDDWLAGLNGDRAAELLAVLARLRADGRTMLLAARPDGAAAELADRVTRLEDGRLAGPPAAGTGGTAPPRPARPPRGQPRGEPLLQIKGLWVADRGREPVAGADLSVRQGEIYGLAGAAGAGQAALLAALVGRCRTEAGRIYLGDDDVTGASVGARRQLGLAYLPAPYQAGGLLGALTLWENAALGQQRRPWCCRRGLLDRRALRAAAVEQAAGAGVGAPDPRVPGWRLTRGERQRLVLARELAVRPALLVAARPTHGLDRASAALLWQRLRQAAGAGLAVLLWSTDPEELLAVADRVGVMAGGRIAAELADPGLDAAELARAVADPAAEDPAVAPPTLARASREAGG
jgi:ABC-type uncharacterized transport system ATPase subunit